MHSLLDMEPAASRLRELVGRIRLAMVTTITEDGSLHGRVALTQECGTDASIWFFTERGSQAHDDLRRSPSVSLTYADPSSGTYAAVSGTAELISDHEKFGDLWDPAFLNWFPDGPHHPSLILTRVTVERIDFWKIASPAHSSPAGCATLPHERGDDSLVHEEFPVSCPTCPALVTTTGPCPSCHTHHVRSYHRVFPTTVGAGESAIDAACDLIRRLMMQRDTVVDEWHRQVVERAIADAQLVLEQLR